MSGNSNTIDGLLSNVYTIIIIIYQVVKHEVKAGVRGGLVGGSLGHWHDVPMLPVNEESLLNRSP